jgi:hypothetical protein
VRDLIGCSHQDFLRLNAAERAACERKMAELPKTPGATVDPIPPLKRGAYDRQALHDERCKRYETPVGAPTHDSINARPVFDSAPAAAQPHGPPPPGPWMSC